VRFLYNHEAFGDFLRPELQRSFGQQNVALYSHRFGVGAGPAAWAHTLLPDYDLWAARGGYSFPLFDRRPNQDSNLSHELLQGLELAYHTPVDPQTVFDAIVALLSASSYTLRFAEDLEDVFPHVPFPAKRALFDEAATVGKQIREVETFARPPRPEFLTDKIARVETAPHGPLAEIGPGSWGESELMLCENGSGRISGIPAAVWQFSVSGYPLLPRWLAARKGIEVTHDFLNEFRDITGRINELIHLFDEADVVLQKAVNHSLTRERLGLESAPAEDEDERP
jgi:predicted helicase